MKYRKKIGVMANTLNYNKTGSGQYLYNLMKCILEIDRNNEYVLLNYENYSSNLSADNLKIKKIARPFGRTPLWNLLLPFKTINQGFDLVFNPTQTPTFLSFSSPYIITVFDMSPILLPETRWGKREKIYYTHFFHRNLKVAKKIIAISENTKKDLIDLYHLPSDKIKVIYLAADKRFKPAESAAAVAEIRKKYELNYPYLLFVGTLEPRKNIPNLIEAFNKIKDKNSKLKLLLVGKKGWKFESIFNLINALKLNERVIYVGYVQDEDIPLLINAAELFVYPSIYEGFGLPPLEAMACGTPVITSDISSLPEVAGDAGIMVDPYNVNELADEIIKVLNNNKLKEELSRKGQERTKLFSWEKCAKETLEVFEEAIN